MNVLTVGIAVASSSLEIFEKKLDAEGYSYEIELGLIKDVILLKVKTDDMFKLSRLVRSASNQIKRAGMH